MQFATDISIVINVCSPLPLSWSHKSHSIITGIVSPLRKKRNHTEASSKAVNTIDETVQVRNRTVQRVPHFRSIISRVYNAYTNRDDTTYSTKKSTKEKRRRQRRKREGEKSLYENKTFNSDWSSSGSVTVQCSIQERTNSCYEQQVEGPIQS